MFNPFVPTNPKLGFSVSLSQFARILEQIEIHRLLSVYGAPKFSLMMKANILKTYCYILKIETSVADWPMS